MTIYRIPSKRYMAVVDEIPVIAIDTTYNNVVKIAQKKITNYFELYLFSIYKQRLHNMV
jgi:hypothetical protein